MRSPTATLAMCCAKANLALFVLLVVLCCSGRAKAQGATTSLYGKWTLANRLTMAYMKLEGGADFGIGIVSDPTTTMVIEFRSDGTAISHTHIEVGYDHSTEYAWKVLEEKSDQLTIKTQTTSSTRKKRITYLDKDTIRFDELDENKSRFPLLIFRRIVPSSDGKSSHDLGR